MNCENFVTFLFGFFLSRALRCPSLRTELLTRSIRTPSEAEIVLHGGIIVTGGY